MQNVDFKSLLKDTGCRRRWEKCAPPTSENILRNSGSQDTVTLSNEASPGPEQSPRTLRDSPAGEVHKWCWERRHLYEKLRKSQHPLLFRVKVISTGIAELTRRREQ